jgi:chemotaxis protein MotB
LSDSHDSHKKSLPLHIPTSSRGHEEEGGEGNWLVSYADMMTLLVGFFVILNSFSTIDQEKFEGIKQQMTKQFGGTYQIPYKEVSDRLRDTINKLGLGNQFVIKQTDAGVEISFLGTVFFNAGSADLKPESKTLMSELVPIIHAESTDFDITVEGHTDDVPLMSGSLFHNNWELSSVRACRVLTEFEKGGFDKYRLTAVGYGDARPIAPNRDAQGRPIQANQTQNRRVVIKLLKRAIPLINVGDQASAQERIPTPAESSTSTEVQAPAEPSAEPAAEPQGETPADSSATTSTPKLAH